VTVGLFSRPGETYDDLEWTARLTLYFPEKSAQTVHDYLRPDRMPTACRRTDTVERP